MGRASIRRILNKGIMRADQPSLTAGNGSTGRCICRWCGVIAAGALVFSIGAAASSVYDHLPNTLGKFFRTFTAFIAALPWGGDVARLVFVMSICGGVGALAHSIAEFLAETAKPIEVRNNRRICIWWSLPGNMLVGAVASNVLHFPLAAVFNYDQLLARGPQNDKPFLSIISLSLLAGYAGPILLDALAKKFQDSVAAKLEERLKSKQDILDRTLRFLLQDILTRRITPNGTDCELLRAKYEEVQRIEAENGMEGLTALDAVVAGYYSLEQERYRDAVRYLENADGKASELKSDGQKWAAKNLLALSYHYDYIHQHDWFKKTVDRHQEALKTNPTPIQEAITLVNLAYAMKDNDDFAGAKAKVEEALKTARKFPEKYSAVRDVAHLCSATVLTLEAIAAAKDSQPPALSPAIAELGKIENPNGIDYLLEDGSIEDSVVDAWYSDQGVPQAIRDILERFRKN